MGHLPHNGSHDTVVHFLEWRQEGRCFFIGILIISVIDNDARTLNAS